MIRWFGFIFVWWLVWGLCHKEQKEQCILKKASCYVLTKEGKIVVRVSGPSGVKVIFPVSHGELQDAPVTCGASRELGGYPQLALCI
jgi:hypothetical protein